MTVKSAKIKRVAISIAPHVIGYYERMQVECTMSNRKKTYFNLVRREKTDAWRLLRSGSDEYIVKNEDIVENSSFKEALEKWEKEKK
jgi:hypothetical protein